MNEFQKQIVRFPILTEVLNAITHGLGVIFGIVGLVLLMIKASTPIEYLSFSIYGICFIVLFLASTLYHSLIFTKAKKVFRVIDHSSIFLLIAGTYIPYLLVGIGSKKSYIFAILMALSAIIGIVCKIVAFEKATKISTIIYLIMGWSIVLIFNDLITSIDQKALYLLIGGGLAYSFGVIFYINEKWLFSHVYWHIAVLIGAILMFFSIYLYI